MEKAEAQQAQPSQRISTNVGILGQLVRDLVDQTSVERAGLKKFLSCSKSPLAGHSKLPRWVGEKLQNDSIHSRLSSTLSLPLRAECFGGHKAICQTRWPRSVGPEERMYCKLLAGWRQCWRHSLVPWTYPSSLSHDKLKPV